MNATTSLLTWSDFRKGSGGSWFRIKLSRVIARVDWSKKGETKTHEPSIWRRRKERQKRKSLNRGSHEWRWSRRRSQRPASGRSSSNRSRWHPSPISPPPAPSLAHWRRDSKGERKRAPSPSKTYVWRVLHVTDRCRRGLVGLTTDRMRVSGLVDPVTQIPVMNL